MPAAKRPAMKPTFDSLEPRIALANTGTWTALANLVPNGDSSGYGGSGTAQMMLLSDGTVMLQGGGATISDNPYWYQLTPDSTGSYVSGNWTKLPNSMGMARAYGSTVTFTDGKFMFLGGEYSGPNLDKNFTNATQIYDPVSQKWQHSAPVTNEVNGKKESVRYGDEPAALLPGGRVITPDGNNTNTYIYSAKSNTWSNGPQRLNGDTSYEENWLKLADGSILAVPTLGSNLLAAQRFVPGIGNQPDQWVAAGTLPAVLSWGGPNGDDAEMGPGFLLPKGRVWQMGGNEKTALYTPPSKQNPQGLWTAGPSLPQPSKKLLLTGADSAGAMMPNGNVIFDASPWLSSPAYFYIFNPRANGGQGKITPISPPQENAKPGAALNIQAQLTSFLVLPNGQVLYDLIGSPQLWVYTPFGSPLSGWRPSIQTVTQQGTSSNYRIVGLQLNGMSEGAAPGDDVAMSTNFPVVRLTSSTGTVTYARTFNWSSVGVQTRRKRVSTLFTLPTSLAAGTYRLQVIASGIASRSVGFKVS